MTDDKILQVALENGMLDKYMDTLRQQVEMKENQKYLEMHEYEIWLGKNGYWYTYLTINGERRQKRSKDKNKLEKMVIAHYKAQHENPTIKELFTEWSTRKLNDGEIRKGSYDRYLNDYKRFFGGSEFEQMQISSVEEEDITLFIRQNIHEKNLSRKAYYGLRILIGGIFRYAKEKKYTHISISTFFADLELSNKMFTHKIKDPNREIFMDDELPQLVEHFKNNPDVWNLGLHLCLLTGLRIGELSSLKWADISGNIITISRTERKEKDESENWIVDVSDDTKTENGNRKVLLPEHALPLLEQLKKLNPNSEWLFIGLKGQRIRSGTFSKRLTRICNELNIPERTAQKLRRTYATTLKTSNLSDMFICSQMGHGDITTTMKSYLRLNQNIEGLSEQLTSATSF